MGLFDKVVDEARGHTPLRLLLTVLAVPFFVAGWLVGLIVRAVGFVAVWAWAACKAGFSDARRKGERR